MNATAKHTVKVRNASQTGWVIAARFATRKEAIAYSFSLSRETLVPFVKEA